MSPVVKATNRFQTIGRAKLFIPTIKQSVLGIRRPVPRKLFPRVGVSNSLPGRTICFRQKLSVEPKHLHQHWHTNGTTSGGGVVPKATEGRLGPQQKADSVTRSRVGAMNSERRASRCRVLAGTAAKFWAIFAVSQIQAAQQSEGRSWPLWALESVQVS